MLKLVLLLRYLRKRKIVLLSIAAVALSTALLIVVSSLFTGFIRAFEQAAVDAMGDVVISPPIKFPQYQLFIEQLERTSVVEAATPTLSAQGLLHLGQGRVRAVKIWGIEPQSRARVTDLKSSLWRQSRSAAIPSFQNDAVPAKVGGFVGIGVVAEPDEKTDEYDFAAIEKDIIGRDVVLVTGSRLEPSPDEASTGGEQGRFKRRNMPFVITDVVFTGVYLLDKHYVYFPIEQLQQVLYPDEDTPVADQIQVKLAAGVDTDVALAQIRGVWQSFASQQPGWNSYLIDYTDIDTARHLQSQYVAELFKQMGLLLLIFGVVSLAVVLLVFCIFYMIVRMKRKDIAIVKSCGGTSTAVVVIFVGFGASAGIIGSGLGTILGYIFTKNVNAIEEWIRIIFGLKLWKSSVYIFSRIPNEINWHSALLIVLSAVSAVAVGALIPALIAARTRPVDILRYE
jgi:ABC-type lipoprotein release transport system permease subunit